eukprot:SAG31_NODE_11165_length_1059_cov_1.089583_1_plen_76_part_00
MFPHASGAAAAQAELAPQPRSSEVFPLQPTAAGADSRESFASDAEAKPLVRNDSALSELHARTKEKCRCQCKVNW